MTVITAIQNPPIEFETCENSVFFLWLELNISLFYSQNNLAHLMKEFAAAPPGVCNFLLKHFTAAQKALSGNSNISSISMFATLFFLINLSLFPL